MPEEQYIKVIPELLERFQKFLMPNEKMVIAFPCGQVLFGQENVHPLVAAQNKDYLIVTEQRLLYIQKDWFKTKRGFNVIPLKLIQRVDVKTYLMGSSLTIDISDGEKQQSFQIDNGPKREAEATYKYLKSRLEQEVCPNCKNQVPRGQYNFCPNCSRLIVQECRSCGKPLAPDWIVCPFCASK